MDRQVVSYRITLVHGTFARGAAWTQDGSRLVQALRTGLDGPVAVERFEWSGGNSAGARAAAARGLADRLRDQADRCPAEQRFVLAHSHGGNVAMYALRDAALAAQVSGVACLATPFLVARRRDLGGTPGVTNIIAAALLALLLVHLTQIEPWLSPWLGESGATAVRFPTVGVLCVLLLLAFRRWDAWADRLLESMRLANLPSRKLLLLRTTGDEASALLLFFQFVSVLAVRLFHALQTLHARVERRFILWSRRKLPLIAALIAGPAAILAATMAWLAAGHPLGRGPAIVVLVVAIGGLIALPTLLLLGQAHAAAIFLRFAATLAVVPAALILALCMLPIDWRVAVANLLVDVTTETAPSGAWVLYQFVPRASDAGGGQAPGLAHSAIYDDERAIGAIVEWIRASGSSPGTDTGACR